MSTDWSNQPPSDPGADARSLPREPPVTWPSRPVVHPETARVLYEHEERAIMSEIEYYIGINLADGHNEEDLKRLVGILRTRPCVDYAVLMADGPEVEPKPEPTREQLPIIGREVALVTALAKKLRAASKDADHAVSDWTPDTKRGVYFEVLIHHEREPTGHVARVTVELDRFDRELVETYRRGQAGR